MIYLGVSVQNIEGFDAQLAEVLAAVDANLNIVADVVLNAAKTSTAFKDKTKTLRGRIRKRKSRYENGGYIVAATAPHAHLVEFGHVLIYFGRVTHRRVPPHPFLRPAKEKGLVEAVNLFRSSK